jgi:hypothetical protein
VTNRQRKKRWKGIKTLFAYEVKIIDRYDPAKAIRYDMELDFPEIVAHSDSSVKSKIDRRREERSNAETSLGSGSQLGSMEAENSNLFAKRIDDFIGPVTEQDLVDIHNMKDSAQEVPVQSRKDDEIIRRMPVDKSFRGKITKMRETVAARKAAPKRASANGGNGTQVKKAGRTAGGLLSRFEQLLDG